MPSHVVFVGFIFILTSSWAIAVEPGKPDRGRMSSAILPPLPDLPIPGSTEKVIGGQEIKAVMRKEPMTQTENPANSNHDLTPSPLVFGGTPESQVVF